MTADNSPQNKKPADTSTASSATMDKIKGSYLLSMEKAKEERKLQLWHSRIAFLKKGHAAMQQKLFSEAVLLYEKYLKILEMVFDCGSGGLTPELFKESARTAELSMVTSVYWDLMRIYDTSDAYGDRQKKAAKKLALFAPLTPLFPDIIKRAQAFQRQCRHPEVVRQFLISAKAERPRCFIATSAFESPLSPEVQSLRLFRDLYLKQSTWGRRFVFYYYKYSPQWACALDKHKYLKRPVRGLLRLLIKCVS